MVVQVLGNDCAATYLVPTVRLFVSLWTNGEEVHVWWSSSETSRATLKSELAVKERTNAVRSGLLSTT
jgi:hypothetical protein